ncbi:hypothetical protein MTO96_025435 [Rhipicephalus appendiculatus]
MCEAQPYRVTVSSISGDVEHCDVVFVGKSPPKHLVCAVCRAVSATEPRYANARSGDFACGACAQSRARPPRLDRSDCVELEELHEGDWNKLPQPTSVSDVRLLKNYWVRGQLSDLGNHLSFTCARHLFVCRSCGQRVVRRDLPRHRGLLGCVATPPPDAAVDPALVWAPEFVNWNRVPAVPDCEQVPAANVVPPALNGAGPSAIVVQPASANHGNWPGRARRTLEGAPLPSGHLPPGSPTPLTGTLLVRFPDCVPLFSDDAPEMPADSPLQSSRLEFFGSDQLVVDGFRLAMSAIVFYDPANNFGGLITPPAASVVFELLARDVDDAEGKYDRRRRWPPASSVTLTLNSDLSGVDRLLRIHNYNALARWLESGRWTTVATTEAIDAEVVCKDFLAFGVIGVKVEFK